MEFINNFFILIKNNTIIFKILLFSGIIFSGFIIILIIKKILTNLFKKFYIEKNKNFLSFINDSFFQVFIPLLYILLFFLAFNLIDLNQKFLRYINILFIVLFTFYFLKFLINLISFFIEIYFLKHEKDHSKIKNLNGILIIIKVLIWGLGFILILDNLGYKVSTVLAGLGIGGIAVALAAQTILGDLFAYFIIVFDKPFEVGDFIIVGDLMGTVENIGLKTTRIRSINGEELIFSNSDLTNSRVKNFKRMYSRRVVFKIGVTYNTSLENLKKIPSIIKNIIESINDTKFDRCHFVLFGDSALIYETVYFVNSSDYNKYMDIQQEINLRICEEFKKFNIEFAFPTQTLYIHKLDS